MYCTDRRLTVKVFFFASLALDLDLARGCSGDSELQTEMENSNPFGGPQQIQVDDADSIATIAEVSPPQYVHVALDGGEEEDLQLVQHAIHEHGEPEPRQQWSLLCICTPLLVTLCILIATLQLYGILDLAFLDGIPSTPGTEDTYYMSVSSLTGQALKRGLKSVLTKGHRPVTYTSLWENLAKVDQGRGCVHDRYSLQCWNINAGTGASVRRCNSASQPPPKSPNHPNDCFNREHSWPNSWWNNGKRLQNWKQYPLYTDMHQIFLADGYVNKMRGNLPLGNVMGAPSMTSSNECKIGKCSHNPTTSCFEPADPYKGEMARMYFYIATRYSSLECCRGAAVNAGHINTWMETILRDYHTRHPVTEAEKLRNTKIYELQGNRNPFVDHPEWVSKIPNF